MSDDPYVYPGTAVLKNKLGIRNPAELDKEERNYVLQRMRQGIPSGDFDLAHLKAIHHHLFQDIFAWAGKIRTVEIAKGGSQFMFRQYIETGMTDVHKRIVKARYFAGTSVDQFAAGASVIIGDVNHVHPFREATAALNCSISSSWPNVLGTALICESSNPNNGSPRQRLRTAPNTPCWKPLCARPWRAKIGKLGLSQLAYAYLSGRCAE